MAKVEIVRVETSSQLSAFVDLPWDIYRDDPNWGPPLKRQFKQLLKTQSHPFWEFSEQNLLLAYRGSKVVGRVAGIIDRNYHKHHDDHTGMWGFFECHDDREAAYALFSEMEGWQSSKGMTRVFGPLNPSTNYEIGLLIQGFEHRATFMMPYNPAYYGWLVESCGYRKEKDLLSFVVRSDWELTDWIQRMAGRLKRTGNFVVRCADMDRFFDELRLIKQIYEDCWSENWGFVPMTEKEFVEMGRNLRRIIEPDLVFIVDYKGEAVGMAVIVPDINPVLKRLNGKLGLLELARLGLARLGLLKYPGEINGLRGLLFGIRKEYRKLGVPFLVLEHLYHVLKQRPHYKYLELGWNLEDNEDINELEQDCGARVFKKYRVFGKHIQASR